MDYIGSAVLDHKAVSIYREDHGLFTCDEYVYGKKERRKERMTLERLQKRYARFDLSQVRFKADLSS